MAPTFLLKSIKSKEIFSKRWFYPFFFSFLDIIPLDIMSDDPGAPRQTFLKIVGHVRRDRRISGSLHLTPEFRMHHPKA